MLSMAFVSFVVLLFFTTFATSEATLLHCSSTDGSGSMAHLQQATTLQHCVVDNCTIMITDTGQKLDIIYTTESLIVINPTNGQTSSVIAKDENELSCYVINNMVPVGQIIGTLVLALLRVAVSGYILVVHLLFKELHNLMGKLMILYNLFLVSLCIITIIWLLLHVMPVNSQITCHIIRVVFMITTARDQSIPTCILTYLTNLMYRSYKLKSEMSKSRSKFLFKCYTAYVFGTMIFYTFLIVAYDLKTGNGRYTIQPLGYCNLVNPEAYNNGIF